jgi:hypothetical protein
MAVTVAGRKKESPHFQKRSRAGRHRAPLDSLTSARPVPFDTAFDTASRSGVSNGVTRWHERRTRHGHLRNEITKRNEKANGDKTLVNIGEIKSQLLCQLSYRGNLFYELLEDGAASPHGFRTCPNATAGHGPLASLKEKVAWSSPDISDSRSLTVSFII